MITNHYIGGAKLKMKITITNYNKTYSVETDEDMDAESMADTFKGLLVSMGYHPCNVDELMNTEYKWFTQEEINNNRQGHLKKAEEWQNNLYKEEL
jgi:Tat protein secretion system quality control protein TatD with DNase activity